MFDVIRRPPGLAALGHNRLQPVTIRQVAHVSAHLLREFVYGEWFGEVLEEFTSAVDLKRMCCP